MTSKGAAPEIITPSPVSAPPSSTGGMPRIDKYELLEEIGHGGMATVYRARDPRLGREVAVKVIHKHLRENTEVATRFVAEARAAAKLRHPGIVEVFDVSSEEDPERYLVVELLRGTTLRKVLQQNREMPAEVGAAIALEICDALEHAHDEGIIHRDIKPENVLVELPGDRAAVSDKTSNPGSDPPRSQETTPAPSEARSSRKGARQAELGVVIKITDFGIAKVLDAQGMTSTGQVLGSPAHMAPEQIEGGEVDARTDVFAVGVLTYEAMVGHLPFEGKNPAQVLRKVLDGVYTQADRERSTVGGRWAKILAGSLAREAEQRTASPRVLAEAIRKELGALGIDDPKAEILAYFRDPVGYSADLTGRLVPKIVTRGEAARRSRDVPGAAADFNRALALAPSDLTILKRLTSLTSSASRRLLAKRVALIAAGTAAATLVAFGATRLVRWIATATPDATAELPASASPVTTTNPPPASAAVPSDTATTAPRASASGKPKSTATAVAATGHPTSQPSALPSQATRKVVFGIKPGGASLTLDDRSLGTTWFGKTFDLAFGHHDYTVSINDTCCQSPKSSGFAVVAPPADKPDEPQTIQISLDLNPATLTLTGAPPSAQVRCGRFTLQANQTLKNVKLDKPVQTLACTYMPPVGDPYPGSATVKAGQENSIPWKPPPPPQ